MENPKALPRSPHQPVLYQQIVDYLRPASPGKYVDGTLGAGGHAAGMLETSAPEGRLLALDVDRRAIDIASERTAQFAGRITILHGSYADLGKHLKTCGWDCVNGILLDLGVSSMQLDNAHRGFSFIKEAPLDMRFDDTDGLTAAQLLNRSSQKELAHILREFGEEPRAKQIAAAIIRNRPLETTTQLASLVSAVYKGQRGRTHPATRTFQALRMAVNSEQEVLVKGLEEAVTALCPQGRLAVISFHSLEDRAVKQFFRRESQDCICPPEQAICTCGHKAVIKVITKRAITPSKEEIAQNPRARSAKLQVAEKIY
jgi:16S rRNA (cytosine1402-N4)-methyltransferase